MNAKADFWKTFAHISQDNSISLQFRCFTGCSALAMTLRDLWDHELLGEWAELMTLAHAVLEERETLKSLSSATAEHLSHDEWLRKLETFIEMKDPSHFRPSFSDVAMMCGLKQHARIADPHYVEWIRTLVEIDQLRVHCAPESANFNDFMGQRGLALLEKARLQGLRFSPIFREAVSEKLSYPQAA